MAIQPEHTLVASLESNTGIFPSIQHLSATSFSLSVSSPPSSGCENRIVQHDKLHGVVGFVSGCVQGQHTIHLRDSVTPGIVVTYLVSTTDDRTLR